MTVEMPSRSLPDSSTPDPSTLSLRGPSLPPTARKPKVRTDLHLARRLYHLFGVVLIVVIYLNISRPLGLAILSGFVAVILPLDYLRLRYGRINRKAMTWFSRLIRTNELSTLSGMSYLLLGALIVIAFFPKPIATLALLMLGIGDPVASTAGILYGKDKIIGDKSLQGSVACFSVCALIAAVYFLTQHLMLDRWVLASLMCGMIGTIAELIPVGRLDDNFTLPILSATMMWFMFRLFGVI